VDYSTAGERVTAVLASGFGAIAALLAGVGIYGLLAYAVAQRRREIGIRMALGASGLDIVNTVGRHALAMTVVGISLGLGSMLLSGRWIRSLLYGVMADDPSSLSMAAVFVAFVAVAAMVTPLARAIRIEPAIALRQEN
jgi:putative ABC transport system permease protein